MGFIAAETGVKRGKISLRSRVAQDLRVDGDDAMELFEKFAATFSVDLGELYARWDQHFLAEGGGVGVGWLVVIGAAVVAGSGLSALVKAIPYWAGTLVALGLFGWIHNRYFVDSIEVDLKPVTVQDLVDAARAGK